MAKNVTGSTTRKVFIKLKAFGATTSQKFEKTHALAILRLPNSKWELADERFMFKDNEIRRKPSKGSNKQSEK